MDDFFLGEIRIFAFGFVPRGWLPCNGQLLSISQNTPLFAILGTTYGGNGTSTFALPNLQGRVPMQACDGVALGQYGGEEGHTLTTQEMPQHTHQVIADSSNATEGSPANGYWAASDYTLFDIEGSVDMAAMAAGVIAQTGGNQPHPNMQPYLVANFCIAVQGIFPTPN